MGNGDRDMNSALEAIIIFTTMSGISQRWQTLDSGFASSIDPFEPSIIDQKVGTPMFTNDNCFDLRAAVLKSAILKSVEPHVRLLCYFESNDTYIIEDCSIPLHWKAE